MICYLETSLASLHKKEAVVALVGLAWIAQAHPLLFPLVALNHKAVMVGDEACSREDGNAIPATPQEALCYLKRKGQLDI